MAIIPSGERLKVLVVFNKSHFPLVYIIRIISFISILLIIIV